MSMEWTEIFKTLIFWGPGAIIAAVIIYTLYKLADKYLGEFIRAQQGQAESLAKLARGSEGLKDCIETFCNRDNSEHREMTILLKVLVDKVEATDKEGMERHEIIARQLKDIAKKISSHIEEST